MFSFLAFLAAFGVVNSISLGIALIRYQIKTNAVVAGLQEKLRVAPETLPAPLVSNPGNQLSTAEIKQYAGKLKLGHDANIYSGRILGLNSDFGYIVADPQTDITPAGHLRTRRFVFHFEDAAYKPKMNDMVKFLLVPNNRAVAVTEI